MTLITIIQSSFFLSFIGYLLIEFKKPLPSISDSWYELPEPAKHLFTLFCWSIGFLMFFQTNGSTGFFHLSGAGLIFTGTATAFKESMTKTVHVMGAYVSILGAFTAIIFERGNIAPLLLFGFSVFLLWRVSNRTWWIEICAFVFIAYGLI